MTGDEDRAGYPGWRVTGAASLGVLGSVLPAATFPMLVTPLTGEFQWSRADVSLAFGCMTMGAAVAAPLVGRLYDRIGPKVLCAASVLVCGGGFAALATIGGALWQLYALLAMVGIAMPGTSAVVYARAVATWFDRRRGVALGAIMASAAAGGISYPLLWTEVATRVGWRTTCVLLGTAVAIVGAPLVAAGVRERSGGPAAHRVPGIRVAEAVRSRTFWLLISVVFGSTLALNGVVVHLFAMLTDRGIDPGRATAIVSSVGAASLAGRLVTGWLLDHLPAARVGAALLAMAASGVALLVVADSGAASLIAVALIGFGTGGEFDVIPYLLSRHFGLASLSTLYGLHWTAWGVAGALGPTLMGRAFDTAGAYDAVLIQFAAGILAAAGLLLAVPRPQLPVP